MNWKLNIDQMEDHHFKNQVILKISLTLITIDCLHMKTLHSMCDSIALRIDKERVLKE